MTDGFTGINIPKFSKEFYDLNDSYTRLLETIKNSFCECFYEIRDVWYSPKAVEVCHSLLEPINSFLTETSSQCNNLLNSVLYAGNFLAAANGIRLPVSLNEIRPDLNQIQNAVLSVVDNRDGAAGMIFEKMDRAFQNIQGAKNKAMVIATNVPQTISLYDANGALIKNYRTDIEKMMNYYDEQFDNAINLIITKMKEQMDELKIAGINANYSFPNF